VPYIDVMLVMLVVFMITAPMLTEGVRVDLPQAAKSEPVDAKGKEPLVVTVDQEGRYFISKQDEPISGEDLLTKVAAVLRREPTTPVLVKGDRAVNYGAVVQVMGVLRQAGAPTVGLITEPAALSSLARGRPKK
jgi:biopolymer transport protein TolR